MQPMSIFQIGKPGTPLHVSEPVHSAGADRPVCGCLPLLPRHAAHRMLQHLRESVQWSQVEVRDVA